MNTLPPGQYVKRSTPFWRSGGLFWCNMVRTRQDIWKLGPSWSDTTLWYAKGVGEILKRPITRADSGLFLAAMHGFDAGTWRSAGYISDSTTPASPPLAWDQCPCRSSYFLPWNRGYLAAFETIVRDAIVQLGGPDNWALPYWNYSDQSNPNARKMPPVFAERTLPDGGINPLFVGQRNGAGGGLIVLTPNDVDLSALLEDSFTGASDGSSPGFGGTSAPFDYNGSFDLEGLVEQAPHDIVHCRIGGRAGLMSSPDTAALDPIFWVHHANIDRLWEVWRRRAPGAHNNSSDLSWPPGPIDRTFVAPRPGGALHRFAAKDMLETTSPRLDYAYEDVSDPFFGIRQAEARSKRLTIREPLVMHVSQTFAPGPKPSTELIGSLDAQTIEGGVIGASINLDRKTIAKLAQSFELFAETRQEPDRIYLNLQDIRGLNDAAIFEAYIGLPKNTVPNDQPDYLGGVVSLFGVSRQSSVDRRRGDGLSKIIDITPVVDRMYVGGRLRRDTLSIQIVPTSDIRPEDRISIGRISLYRRRG